jgi:hypothetical protein
MKLIEKISALKELREQYEENEKLCKRDELVLYGLIDELEQCGAVEASNIRGYRFFFFSFLFFSFFF